MSCKHLKSHICSWISFTMVLGLSDLALWERKRGRRGKERYVAPVKRGEKRKRDRVLGAWCQSNRDWAKHSFLSTVTTISIWFQVYYSTWLLSCSHSSYLPKRPTPDNGQTVCCDCHQLHGPKLKYGKKNWERSPQFKNWKENNTRGWKKNIKDGRNNFACIPPILIEAPRILYSTANLQLMPSRPHKLHPWFRELFTKKSKQMTP